MAARLFRIEHEGTSRYALERDGGTRLIDGDVFEQWGTGRDFRLGSDVKPTKILAPVQPSKIVALGLNYRDHAAERGKELPVEPMIFIKPSTAVIGPGDPIRLPPGAVQVEYEAEVALIIGRRAYRVPPEKAWDYVLGVTALNDVTERELQRDDQGQRRWRAHESGGLIGFGLRADTKREARSTEY